MEISHEEIIKKSYGNDFANAKELAPIGHVSVITYDGEDPLNKKLRKVQEVQYYTEEADAYNCIPEMDLICGITTWINEFGYEVKKTVIRSTSYEGIMGLNDNDFKGSTTFERKNGMIYKNGKEIWYEHGIKKLPTFLHGKFSQEDPFIKYTQESTIELTSSRNYSDDKVLENFDKCVEIENNSSQDKQPGFEEYINELRESLIFSLRTENYRNTIKQLQNENASLTTQLRQAFSILREIKSNPVTSLALSSDDKRITTQIEATLFGDKRNSER